MSILPGQQVSYRCVASKPSDVELVRVCENGRHRIECPNNRKINIVFANYGRLKGAHICRSLGVNTLNTQCGASTSMSVVRHDCQGQQHCELIATNGKFGGDPCFLTAKYLEVSQVVELHNYCSLTPKKQYSIACHFQILRITEGQHGDVIII